MTRERRLLARLLKALDAIDRCPNTCIRLDDISEDRHGRELRAALAEARKAIKELEEAN